jgi:hypothetical protein
MGFSGGDFSFELPQKKYHSRESRSSFAWIPAFSGKTKNNEKGDSFINRPNKSGSFILAKGRSLYVSLHYGKLIRETSAPDNLDFFQAIIV